MSTLVCKAFLSHLAAPDFGTLDFSVGELFHTKIMHDFVRLTTNY